MALKFPTLFPHRLNRDRSFDSICPICFATIANEKSESDLAEFDRDHVCDPVVMLDRANFRPPTHAKNTVDLAREICNTVFRKGLKKTKLT
jgi:hypothetical protein